MWRLETLIRKRRLDAIKLCGLFGGWEHEDLMRLTRMSRIHRHPSKSVLLMQRKVRNGLV